jgi:hypothetical protein
MIRQSFISVVGILHSQNDVLTLPAWLSSVYQSLQANFSDYEIVLINNQRDLSAIENIIKPLPEELRKQIFLLNLSSAVNRDNAILAGLDRANGDYTVLFESDFASNPDLIVKLWDTCHEGHDVVCLRASERKLPVAQKALYHIFYYILKRYSRLQIDPWAHHSRIISRRALNSLLRLRENSRYLKANYALVGYKTGHIDHHIPALAAALDFYVLGHCCLYSRVQCHQGETHQCGYIRRPGRVTLRMGLPCRAHIGFLRYYLPQPVCYVDLSVKHLQRN